MRWWRTLQITVSLVALTWIPAGCASVAPPQPHPGDAAFAAGDHAVAVAAYRAGLQTGRPLEAAQRLRLVAATAAVDAWGGTCDQIADVADELQAVSGATPEAAVLWEMHRRCRQAEAVRRAAAARMSDLESRLARALDDAAALAARSRELEERLGHAEEDRRVLGSRLAELRDRLRDVTENAARLRRQIDELKRIDLDGGG